MDRRLHRSAKAIASEAVKNLFSRLKPMNAYESDLENGSTSSEELDGADGVENSEESEDADDENSEESEDSDGDGWKKEDIVPPQQLLERFDGDGISQGSPYDYFRKYFTPETIKKICFETNAYAFQRFGKTPVISESEMEQFIGICLYFGIYQLPRTRIVWLSGSAINVISSTMPRDRFEGIRRYLHFLDQEQVKNNPDRLCKIRLFIDPIQEAMNNIAPSNVYSIDEQMVSFKGRTVLRQYMPAKPTKWGVKIFILCASNGLMHKFLIYDGQNHFEGKHTSDLVLHLCSGLPAGSQVCFDNYFSSLSLIESLRVKNVFVVSTLKANRSDKVADQLESENMLKKRGRGSMDFRTNASNDTIVLRWFDNRAVLMCSTFSGVGEATTVSRWDRSSKSRIEVPAPDIITAYNRHMGGVDFVNSLLALYKIRIRSKKWTTRIFYHFLDVAVTNSWLEYRRDHSGSGAHTMDLMQFRVYIAECLVKKGKATKRKAGRQSHVSAQTSSRQKKACLKPNYDVRKDGLNHIPYLTEKKGKWALCSTSARPVFSKFKCQKCDAFLCIKLHQNCFETYHYCSAALEHFVCTRLCVQSLFVG